MITFVFIMATVVKNTTGIYTIRLPKKHMKEIQRCIKAKMKDDESNQNSCFVSILLEYFQDKNYSK